MDFPTASTDLLHLKLSCPAAWKAECETFTQVTNRPAENQNLPSTHCLAWEVDYDEQCGISASEHTTQNRRRIYGESWETGDTSRRDLPAYPESKPAGDVHNHNGNTSSFENTGVYSAQDEHIDQEGDSDDEISDDECDSDEEISDDKSESDEALYDDDFEYEPANSYPEWTRTISPSLNPSRHSTPPEVMKWVYWPPIYDSLERIRYHVGDEPSLRKTVCVKAALEQIEFADYSAFDFPYAAMGRLRPLRCPPLAPYLHRKLNLRTPSSLRQVEECRYP
ncbi:hypothetical protein IWX50DRAFT_616862 [Phyllosticta citricarpa]|uniref:Uncharacterized protein n=1 Tax=Phyllosticta citricarpa TaxID=55181 RepID=A0ABR1M6I0_9PEZI